ncbi:hypothetical protein ACFQ0D_03285, partial [Micromonospora zhanjiangensis]
MTTETTVGEPAVEPVGAVTDEQLIAMLVDRARGDGLKLTGEGGLLQQLTKRVLESALEGEITDHVGYDKHDQVAAGLLTTSRVDEMIAKLPAGAWKHRSAGDGAHGPRVYDWVATPIRRDFGTDRRGWVLARRSICDP